MFDDFGLVFFVFLFLFSLKEKHLSACFLTCVSRCSTLPRGPQGFVMMMLFDPMELIRPKESCVIEALRSVDDLN